MEESYDCLAREAEWADLDFTAKVCFVMDCRVEDLLAYEPPEGIHTAELHGKTA